MSVYFHTEEPLSFTLQSKKIVKSWLQEIVTRQKRVLGTVNIIFCDDEYLLNINREHLQHDYYTDIVTFDYCEENEVIGDLYISVDRVKENADELKVQWREELRRVMVHGVLHLLGFSDKSEKDKKNMRKLEDEALELLRSLS